MAITMLAGYLVIINAAALVMMAEDKRRAKRHQWRVPEAALFGAALLGGSAGAWAGMYLFHHKTKHWYFVVGMPLILAAQLAAGVGDTLQNHTIKCACCLYEGSIQSQSPI